MLRVTSRTLLALSALGLLAACGGDGKRLWNVDYAKGIPVPSREEAVAARRPMTPGPAVDPTIAAAVARDRQPKVPPPWPLDRALP